MRNLISALFFLFLFLSPLGAKVKPASVLGDNMVLQQQTDVKLWGEAEKDRAITVKTSWDGKTYKSRTDNTGRWLLTVSTPAAGGPYEITISDGEALTLKNILIGEVWFCSGQSNMEMPMRGFDRQPMQGGNDVIAKAKAKTPIRMFIMDSKDGRWVRQFSKTPQTDCIGEWYENSPEHVAETSAVAHYFASYLQEVLEVPVGLIISSWGGSKVEAWMSREAISPFTNIDLSILDNDAEVKNPTATPCVLYNAKINPLTNFAIKGFLWYQGESNRDNADQYASLMPAFVKDLRNRWNVGDFPFYFVQIAPFNYEGADKTSAARLREVQTQNMKDIPNSGMVTTMDVGHPVFIHPVDKKTVGDRLAYWALGHTYGLKGFAYAPPIYKSMEKVDGKIYINFDHAPRGLCPMWTSLEGFEIAGEDRVFYPAFAEIETKSCRLAVSSDKVPEPVAVRYAYKNYIEPSIFSIQGIPVAPFRTDNW
ncbi:sialate O-acetylesterase [Bacteroides sp. 51]|uniref:sialate O-acetylesterase n=1 Tax=Bacteroides sp. 51 TaxID=2302938 RepID=UPI0013D30961|nr:sialate O-acetylesterase [Bacteroides sp. 51]NDV81775.1 sialate O-acetylesterase [Bacteroides sp. 51]